MVRSASLFSQLLEQIPRTEFAALVAKHRAERHARGFTCWEQLVAMLFCQFGRADSLREIFVGLKCCVGKRVHLGIADAPSRSTLSYANEHRPALLYEDLFYQLLARFRAQGQVGPGKHAFRFKNKLLSLDSTTISLCLNLFEWARFRRAKGGVKAHVLMNHADYLPEFVDITPARRADATLLPKLRLSQGSIIVMDRAYNSYTTFGRFTREGVYFVTRMKETAKYEVVETHGVPQNRGILRDETIRLSGVHAKVNAQKKCPYPLRRIVVWDEENERELVFLTNHLEFGATTIASIYKERWQIEVFFKTLKQTLKIKSFVGTSENAVRIQIWTALIALLLLKWLHHQSKAGWTFTTLATALRLCLFSYVHLSHWLDNPYEKNPEDPVPEQLRLAHC